MEFKHEMLSYSRARLVCGLAHLDCVQVVSTTYHPSTTAQQSPAGVTSKESAVIMDIISKVCCFLGGAAAESLLAELCERARASALSALWSA